MASPQSVKESGLMCILLIYSFSGKQTAWIKTADFVLVDPPQFGIQIIELVYY